MTEKRFEEYDNGFEDKIKNEYFETNKEIVDRLNALHKENEQLRQKIKSINEILSEDIGYIESFRKIEEVLNDQKKRFRVEKQIFDGYCITDNHFKGYYAYEKQDLEKFCEFLNDLNDLNDENERLQTHLSQLAKSNREGVKKVQSLAKENEQLKKSVKRQQSSNNECVKLIEKQQKEIEQLKEEIKDLNDILARYEERVLKERTNHNEQDCGHCKHLQIDGMFGMWCEKKHNWIEVEYCEDFER